MKRSWSILSFVMLVLSSAGLPATASACAPALDPAGTPPPPPRDDTDLHWGVAIGTGLALNLTLVGLQAAAGGDGFSDVAGGFEIAFGVLEASVGTLFVPVGVIAAGSSSTCGDNPAGATYTLGSGIAMMVAGTWHLIHAIWSVASPNDVPDVAPTAWFDEHGGSVGLVGRF